MLTNAYKYMIAVGSEDVKLRKLDLKIVSRYCEYQSPVAQLNWWEQKVILLAFTLAPLHPKTQVTGRISFAGALRKRRNRRDKSETRQPCQHCSVNTWAARHLGVLVTAVTHHCLMKLETQRNTNLDIAGYLYDIGHVKLPQSAYASTYRRARQTKAFCGSTARPAAETKKQLRREVFVLLTILSNNPNLHLLPLMCDCKSEPGLLCINYGASARSPPGPEDTGNYSLCQWSRWTPVDEETSWWGHGAHYSPKTLPLTLWHPPSFSLSFLLSCFLRSWMWRGVRRRRKRVFLCLLSQREALLRHSGISQLLFSPSASPRTP